MITLEDIRNPSVLSGFSHVRYCVEGGKVRPKPYIATDWPNNYRGPRRATAERAAQDYCDYMNGRQASPAPQLKTAGHAKPVSQLPSSPEAQEARRILREEAAARREGRQGHVYLVAEKGFESKVKIGHTYLEPPEARLNGLQTGNPRKLVMLATRPGTEADEDTLHARFIQHNILGEWFWNHTDILKEFDLLGS